MDVERVEEVVKVVSAGNEDMEKLLNQIWEDGKDIIQRIPNDKRALLARKMVHTVGCLVHRRINFEEYVVKRKGYWNTPEGLILQKRVTDFVVTRGIKG